MRIIRLLGPVLGSTTLLVLLLLLIAGCGTNPTSTGAAASVTATATPCPRNQFQTAIGTIQSIGGSTLVITTMQGKSIKATYSSSTRFLRQTSPSVSSLKEGTAVTVAITQNADNTYTATRIMVTDSSARNLRQGTGSNANCFNRSQFTNSGGRRSGGTTNTRGITGTVGQVNGNTLYDMNFTTSGQVNAINVHVGQQVKAGQILATLNSTSLQDALTVAQQSVTNAQVTYDDAVNNGASQSVLDFDYDQWQTAQDQLKTAQDNLAATTLVAPGNATIASINGVKGEYVGSGSSSSSTSTQAFMVLTDTSKLTIAAQVNEADIASVQVGQPAQGNVS